MFSLCMPAHSAVAPVHFDRLAGPSLFFYRKFLLFFSGDSYNFLPIIDQVSLRVEKKGVDIPDHYNFRICAWLSLKFHCTHIRQVLLLLLRSRRHLERGEKHRHNHHRQANWLLELGPPSILCNNFSPMTGVVVRIPH